MELVENCEDGQLILGGGRARGQCLHDCGLRGDLYVALSELGDEVDVLRAVDVQVGDLRDFEVAFLVSVLLSLEVNGEAGEVEVGSALSDDHGEEYLGDRRCLDGAVEGQVDRADPALDVLVVDLVQLDKLKPLLDLPQGQQVRHLRSVNHDDVVFDY